MPGVKDTFILSLKNSYNSYTRTLVDNDNITIKNLENKLKVDLDKVKQKYKLDTNKKYTPEETKESIQTNFNNGLYNGVSFGSSPKEVFSNYKTERKLLIEKKQQDVKLITQNTLNVITSLNDQILVTINQYKETKINNVNTINNTRMSLKGSPFTQLSKYKTHKNTEIQSDLKELYGEYNDQQELGGCCCCISSECLSGYSCCSCMCFKHDCEGNCTDLDECCGGTAYDPSGAEGCCGGHTYDPEIENCCDGTMFCSYYSNSGGGCYYNNITLSGVIVDGSCTDGFKWAGYIHWNSAYNVALVNINNISAEDGACAYAQRCGQGGYTGESIPCSTVGGYVNNNYYNSVTTQSQTNSSITLPT